MKYFLAVLFLTTSLSAEVWQCSENIYTTTKLRGCELLMSSVTCGSNGNKFIGPFNPQISSDVEACKVSESSASPFVDLKKAEWLKQKTALVRAEKKITGGGTNMAKNLPGFDGLANYFVSEYQKIWSRYDELLE